MSEDLPDQQQATHTYPHQVGEVDAAQLAQDMALHPGAYHPGLDPHMIANGIDVQRPAFETAAVKAAETEPVRVHDWEQIAADVPLTQEHQTEHNMVGVAVDPEYADRSASAQRAVAVVAELGAVAEENARRWEYVDDEQLQKSAKGRLYHSNAASEVLRADGLLEDKELAHGIANAVDLQRAKVLAASQAELAHLESVPVTDQNMRNLEAAKGRVRTRMGQGGDPAKYEDYGREAVTEELSERERLQLEAAIELRVEADRSPLTMPDSKVSPEIMEMIKRRYEEVIVPNTKPAPDDLFRIPPPMQQFEGAAHYTPADEALLAAGGVNLTDWPHGTLQFTREELQQAGVFFVNRVGGGEQPLFGVPIPDPESEGGVFNVQDRSFLTRAEFEKVYNYQQQHGYGIGDRDPTDVQTDMLMFALRPEGRESGVRKGHGFGGRETKYGDVRSPFVDQGFIIKAGVETYVFDPDGARQRINTTTIHLANGHPDYPGVSEMFDPNTVSHDQKYMSAGEFAARYYRPLPTKQEVLKAMQLSQPTRRERDWVGEWPTE